jgi:hypothetical protein
LEEGGKINGTAGGETIIMRSRSWTEADKKIGHLLVTTRQHKVKVADMGTIESREIGA